MSFGFWEAYVTEKGNLKKLWEIKAKMTDGTTRGPTYLLVSLWKMGIFLMLMSLLVPGLNILPNNHILYTKFTQSFERNEYIINSGIGTQIFQEDFLLRWDLLWESPAILLLIQVTYNSSNTLNESYGMFNIFRYSAALLHIA